MCVNNCKIGFIGAGKMASAIIGGIVKSNFLPSANIQSFDVNEHILGTACAHFDIVARHSIRELCKDVDVIVIATKPFVIQDVLKEMEGICDNKLVISILAGVKIETIAKKLPNSRIIRVMPNTPALVGEGMCAICPDEKAAKEDVEFVEKMLSNIGTTVKVEEKDIDIVTAVSGSGPAFYYYIIDLIARAGEKLGLDYKTCLTLSAQTALGSAKMLLETETDAKDLITAVTTPGGCTAEGNRVLNNSDLEKILDETIEETMKKAKALG